MLILVFYELQLCFGMAAHPHVHHKMINGRKVRISVQPQ
jgi:hypothetical protein